MSTIRRTESSVTRLFLAATLLFAAGCRGPWSDNWKFSDMFDLDKATPWGDDGPEVETPVRLVGTWADTVLHQTGKKPQRGFGGRLIFYGEGSNDPILVDGELVVYAFDESNREPTDNKPTRRYVFPADQIARRLSETELGPSYSFWLPWDEVGGPQTQVSLIARFQPKDGAVVVGEQTKHLLPGELTAAAFAGMAAGRAHPDLPEGIPMRPAAAQLSSATGNASGANSQVELASYEAPIQPPPQRMTTTSISLPTNFRLRGSSPTQATTVQGANSTANSVLPAVPPNQSSTNEAGHPMRPAPTSYQPFSLPPQSPLGQGFAAPIPQQQFATVTYPPAAAKVGLGATGAPAVLPQSSFGFQSSTPQAPVTPAFR
jgi:hypothetical protein